MAFAKGARAAWSQNLPAVYGQGSTLRATAVRALDPKAVTGTIVEAANERGTLYKFVPDEGRIHADAPNIESSGGIVVLTSDELIGITEE